MFHRSDNNSNLNFRSIKITSVTKQVVQGLLYHIKGIFEDENSDQFNCSIHIWEREWQNPKHVITLKKREKLDEKISVDAINESTSSVDAIVGSISSAAIVTPLMTFFVIVPIIVGKFLRS